MKAKLVDFHCHLDLYPDPASAIAAADGAGIYTLSVTTTPRAWVRNRELTAPTRHIRAALGLHPQVVSERADEITVWEDYLNETRYVGEVGIDAGPHHYRSLGLQQQVFERVLRRCAQDGGKILTVHSVRAGALVLDMIEALLPPQRGRVVLHWFSGSISEARRAINLGCFFSVNASMARHERGRKLVATLPSNRLLTETDGPFTEINGRPARPSDVQVAVAEIAKLRAVSPEDMATTVLMNLRSLLGDAGDPLE